MFEISIIENISSAHFLREYQGECEKLHGHNYKIEAFISSKELNSIGMVTDFAEVKTKLKNFLKNLDHVNLNDVDFFNDINPSAENIAKYIFDNFSQEVKPLKLSKVRVWESDTSSAIYYE